MVHPEVRPAQAKLLGGNRQVDGLQQRVAGSAGAGPLAGAPVTEGKKANVLHTCPNRTGRTGIPVGVAAAPEAHCWDDGRVDNSAQAITVLKTILLFALAAAAEIGGAWLVWQSVREGRDWWWAGLGVLALGAYGFVATLQPDPHFGRILAAYGGVFVAGSLAWGMAFDGFRPDRWDVAGSAICLLGVAVIMFAPRSAG